MRKSPIFFILAAAFLLVACTEDGPTALAPDAAQLAIDGCEVPANSDELLDALEADVAALHPAILNAGRTAALRQHLENARRQIERNRYCPARAQLRAFRTQAANFVDAGILTAEQGEPLIAGADVLLGEAAPPPPDPEPTVLEFVSVSAGETHTCGLTSEGRAYCWGNGSHGRLGNGATDNQLEPVAVSGNLTFASISAAQHHTCALTEEGDAYCWGSGERGRLGTGSTDETWVPVAVSTDQKFTSISAGHQHTCALSESGQGYCWGRGGFGELGNGSFSDSAEPVQVTGGLTFATISAGSPHTCGVTTDDVGYCWGNGSLGQLGAGSTIAFQAEPLPVSGGHAFAHISASQFYTCGWTTAGDGYCWGENEDGRLGTGSLVSGEVELEPAAVVGGLTFASISTGGRHTAALGDAGEAYAWGGNGSGQLGRGFTSSPLAEPDAVVGGLTFTSISAGGSHVCGLATDDQLYCWGWGFHGQLGTGLDQSASTPTLVARQ